jgi:hypothetical protein
VASVGIGLGDGQTGQGEQVVAGGHVLEGTALAAAGTDCVGSLTGSGAHAARTAPSKIPVVEANAELRMWVVLLEMGVALGIALLIVWWTWPKKRPQDKDKP